MCNFRIFNLIGKINEDIEKEFSVFAEDALLNPKKPLIISMNTPGGDVTIAFEIYKKIRDFPNPVFTLLCGNCSNIANIISLAVPFERRFAFEYSNFSLSYISGISDSNLLNVDSDTLEEINFKVCEIINSQTDIPDEKLIDIYINDTGDKLILNSEDFESNKIAKIINTYEDVLS